MSHENQNPKVNPNPSPNHSPANSTPFQPGVLIPQSGKPISAQHQGSIVEMGGMNPAQQHYYMQQLIQLQQLQQQQLSQINYQQHPQHQPRPSPRPQPQQPKQPLPPLQQSQMPQSAFLPHNPAQPSVLPPVVISPDPLRKIFPPPMRRPSGCPPVQPNPPNVGTVGRSLLSVPVIPSSKQMPSPTSTSTNSQVVKSNSTTPVTTPPLVSTPRASMHEEITAVPVVHVVQNNPYIGKSQKSPRVEGVNYDPVSLDEEEEASQHEDSGDERNEYENNNKGGYFEEEEKSNESLSEKEAESINNELEFREKTPITNNPESKQTPHFTSSNTPSFYTQAVLRTPSPPALRAHQVVNGPEIPSILAQKNVDVFKSNTTTTTTTTAVNPPVSPQAVMTTNIENADAITSRNKNVVSNPILQDVHEDAANNEKAEQLKILRDNPELIKEFWEFLKAKKMSPQGHHTSEIEHTVSTSTTTTQSSTPVSPVSNISAPATLVTQGVDQEKASSSYANEMLEQLNKIEAFTKQLFNAFADDNSKEIIRLINLARDFPWNINEYYPIYERKREGENGQENNQLLGYYTPLGYAIEKGYLDVVKVFLHYGAKINKGSQYRPSDKKRSWKVLMTPCMIAVKKNNTEILKCLITACAKVDLRGYDSKNSLLMSIAAENIDMVKMLVEEGAAKIDQKVKGFDSSLKKLTFLEYAIYLAGIKKTEKLNNIVKYLKSLTPEKIALIKKNHRIKIETVYKKRNTFINQVKDHMKNQDPDKALALLREERDFQFKIETRIKQKTLLVWASYYHEVENKQWHELIHYLVNLGASVDVIVGASTPLVYAVKKADIDLVKFFLKFFLGSSEERRRHERYSVEAAISQQHAEIVRMLVVDANIPTDETITRGKKTKTLLEIAKEYAKKNKTQTSIINGQLIVKIVEDKLVKIEKNKKSTKGKNSKINHEPEELLESFEQDYSDENDDSADEVSEESEKNVKKKNRQPQKKQKKAMNKLEKEIEDLESSSEAEEVSDEDEQDFIVGVKKSKKRTRAKFSEESEDLPARKKQKRQEQQEISEESEDSQEQETPVPSAAAAAPSLAPIITLETLVGLLQLIPGIQNRVSIEKKQPGKKDEESNKKKNSQKHLKQKKQTEEEQEEESEEEVKSSSGRRDKKSKEQVKSSHKRKRDESDEEDEGEFHAKKKPKVPQQKQKEKNKRLSTSTTPTSTTNIASTSQEKFIPGSKQRVYRDNGGQGSSLMFKSAASTKQNSVATAQAKKLLPMSKNTGNDKEKTDSQTKSLQKRKK
jgi:hypothetical protein